MIEVAPLAFMRGRTLTRAFVILDEAQNATSAQMKMALTRLGEDSQMVVTGDRTQSDLPGGRPEGLDEALAILGKAWKVLALPASPRPMWCAIPSSDALSPPVIIKKIRGDRGGDHLGGGRAGLARPSWPAAMLKAAAQAARRAAKLPARRRLTILLADDARLKTLNRDFRS